MFTVTDQFGIYQANDLDHALDIMSADNRAANLFAAGEPILALSNGVTPDSIIKAGNDLNDYVLPLAYAKGLRFILMNDGSRRLATTL